MAKKNKDMNNNAWVVVGVVVVSVLLYFVSSYSGLLGTKTYMENENAIVTALKCTRTADNTLKATLTVNDEAQPDGGPLAYQTILFSVTDGSGAVNPSSSTTDGAGLVKSTFDPTDSKAISSIIASFAGNTTSVKIEGASDIAVAYEPSSALCN